MALVLVVTTPFREYRTGDIITDAMLIDAIRASEDVSATVMVSDVPITPPVPTPMPSLGELQAAYRDLLAQYTATRTDLAQTNALNQSQENTLAAQAAQIINLATAIAVLSAKIDNPNGGVPLPPNLADDLPLAEADGDILVEGDGDILKGDLR